MYESTIQDIAVVVPMKCLAELLEVERTLCLPRKRRSQFLHRKTNRHRRRQHIRKHEYGYEKKFKSKNLRSQSLSL